jgi:hypothetical protein
MKQFAQLAKGDAEKRKKFYKSYMGSYSERKRILKYSENMLK